MGAYNIVGAGTLVAGQPEDVSQVLANLQAIQTVLNGNIDNTNVNAAAGIILSKLGQSGASSGQAPVWNGSNWAAANVDPTKLVGYPADSTKALYGDGTWKTSFPRPVIAGAVAAAGTISAGSGFTVVHSSTGQYAITIPAISNPIILATPQDQSVVIAAVMNSTTSATVLCTTPGAFTDQRFQFVIFSMA